MLILATLHGMVQCILRFVGYRAALFLPLQKVIREVCIQLGFKHLDSATSRDTYFIRDMASIQISLTTQRGGYLLYWQRKFLRIRIRFMWDEIYMIEVDLGFDFDFDCLQQKFLGLCLFPQKMLIGRKGFQEGMSNRKKRRRGKAYFFSYKQILRLHANFPQVAWHSMTPFERYGALDVICRFMEQNGSDLLGNNQIDTL